MAIPATAANILTLTAFAVLCFGQTGAPAASANNRVSLPVEIAGEAGTVVSVTAHVPAGSGRKVRSLWMQVHGVAYGGMASVRINQGAWLILNNETAMVAGPARSYGGIGGGFATLKLTVPLPEGSVADGSDTIEFRFNFTNGVSSGFRILAFDFLAADGRTILPPDMFVEEDPNTWAAPLNDPENISAGRNLWERAQLTANALPRAPAIRAHCADCHAQDGADLKYFNFSNLSIIARSRFHGLSEFQGRQIASYIRSLPVPNPGRPWNPPYQPGPGLDDQPSANSAAGAGLAWVLDGDANDDSDALPFLFAKKDQGSRDTKRDTFRPDADLNQREIPIAFQLPDWNHWLPRAHPLDFPGTNFSNSAFFRLYRTSDYSRLLASGGIPGFFDKWNKSRSLFLPPRPSAGSNQWTAELAEAFYSAQLWQLVKTWEITRKSAPRFWMNAVPAATAPAEVGIPNGPSGMGRSALTNEYFNNAWYEVQILVNSGNHRHHDRQPIDWVYIIGHFLDLQRLSGRPEPGRLLVAVIKAMQSSDPAIGPDNYAEGWRPDRNIDPRILVSREWAPEFGTIPAGVKHAIVRSLLSAWLDKTLQYPLASYFSRGQPVAYRLPAHLLDISGGRVWDASPQFQAAGVGPALMERLDAWGKAHSALAELFHY